MFDIARQYRLFEQVMMTLPADGSEDLQMILSASKCLDLLLVLQTEEFQMFAAYLDHAMLLLMVSLATNGYSSLTPWTPYTALKIRSQKP